MSERVKELVQSMESENHQEVLKKRRENRLKNKGRGRSFDNYSVKTKRIRLRHRTSVNTVSSCGFSDMDQVHHIITQTQSASNDGTVTAIIEGNLL